MLSSLQTFLQFMLPTVVTKVIAPRPTNKIRNPNIEIRNKLTDKQISNRENPKPRIRRKLVWNFIYFGHLKLFRISDFVLRLLLLTLCARHSFSDL